MSTETAHFLGTVLYIWTAIAATVSVGVYSFSPWYKHGTGRYLMSDRVVIATILDLGIIKLLFGDSHGFQLLRLATFACLPIVTTWLLILMVTALFKRDSGDPSA